MLTKPPVKSAGNSADMDLYTIILSINEDGRTSKEKARLSASLDGVVALFSHTLLYRWANPLIMTNRSSTIVMPGMRRKTSEASLSCVLDIC